MVTPCRASLIELVLRLMAVPFTISSASCGATVCFMAVVVPRVAV